jgi:hypothetical protein
MGMPPSPFVNGKFTAFAFIDGQQVRVGRTEHGIGARSDKLCLRMSDIDEAGRARVAAGAGEVVVEFIPDAGSNWDVGYRFFRCVPLEPGAAWTTHAETSSPVWTIRYLARAGDGEFYETVKKS